MRYGFVLPGGTAREQVELAVLAESAGWDGVFVWEAAYGVDAWTLLGAMAARTAHVRLGTMLTPLPWRRPWKVASQAATVDHLSEGRAIVAVGLGATDTELGNTGEVLDRRVRASMLDEGIDVMTAMWSGELAYSGQHYQVDLRSRRDLFEVASPWKRERVPMWVVGAWPRPRSMRRVVRCDGLLPVVMGDDGGFRATAPGDVRDMIAWLDDHGGRRPGFDVVMEGETPADDPAKAAELVAPWRDAGCTWWLEARWAMPHHGDDRMREVRQRLEGGPPPA
jgi:hypothetical protein